VRVGINILNFGPGARPETLLGWARIAESLGYHSLWTSDHVAVTPDVARMFPEPFYDPYALLTFLAGQTERVQLGTTVIVLPYRHPVLMARLGANIDRLSGGRFIFGVGVGNFEREFASLGVPHNRRGAIGDEYLDVIRRLWTEESVSLDGRFVQLDEVAGIAAHQRPHPPIWVGGSSDGALRRAVLQGDAWHPVSFTMSWLRETGLPRLAQMAAEHGQPVPTLCPRIRLNLTDEPIRGDERLAGAGSLQQLRDDLEALVELGAEHVVLDWYTFRVADSAEHERGWRALALVAEQVLDLERETLR
jgi:probable F420-dependent oxidoreductase